MSGKSDSFTLGSNIRVRMQQTLLLLVNSNYYGPRLLDSIMYRPFKENNMKITIFISNFPFHIFMFRIFSRLLPKPHYRHALRACHKSPSPCTFIGKFTSPMIRTHSVKLKWCEIMSQESCATAKMSAQCALAFLTDLHNPTIRTWFADRKSMAIPSVRLSVCLSVCPSVRPSVTGVDQSKTVKARITQFSPYSSPIPLVCAG